MGYLGRRIGLSQGSGNSTPGSADGAVGGGILDLFAQGYFQREGNIYNAPGVPASGLTATGGVISDYTDLGSGNIYRAHVFTSSGTFDVESIGDLGASVEYLVVAGGGGGGGGYYGGGGGAGGLRTNLSGHPLATGNPSFTVTAGPTSYTVTIGGGGAPGAYGPGSPINSTGNNGAQGVDSYFGPPSAPEGITSKGGGKGMGRSTSSGGETAGYSGGSGGGIGYRGPAVGYGYNPSTPAPVLSAASLPSPYPITQGNPGGAAPPASPLKFGSGGGGAGAVGGDGTVSPNYGGPGGIGVQVYIAGPSTTTGIGETAQWFAGGGAGGANGPIIRTGGVGGGGNAGNSLVAGDDAESGMSGTGGGGGGGTSSPNPGPGAGGAGGGGIVVVRYQIGTVSGTKATGGAISYYGGKTIHTFTGSGTFETTSDIPSAEVVVIGGGGAGGYYRGGGGGAGGVAVATNVPFSSPNPYAVVVGAGAVNRNSSAGVDTTIATGPGHSLTGKGGGSATLPHSSTIAGGSGAGVHGSPSPNTTGGTSNQSTANPGAPFPITPYGNAGGNAPGSSPKYGASGGGGAGNAGDTGDGNGGGDGGIGIRLPSTFRNPASAPGPLGGGLGAPGPGSGDAALFWVAGGGAGGAIFTPVPSVYGGAYPGGSANYAGAGGAGPNSGGGPGPGMNATANTGSGGGGQVSADDGDQTLGGSGGSGIVLIAYPT